MYFYQNLVCTSPVLHTCHMLCPSHSFLLDHANNIAIITGFLSPRHVTSSGWGRRNGLQIWRVASSILKNQTRTAGKGWSSSLDIRRQPILSSS
jgi:hypothetical protein